MNERKLIRQYERYKKSKQYYAELFVRKYCKNIKSTDLIVIKSAKASRKYIINELQFQKVVFEAIPGRIVIKKQKSADGFSDSILTNAMQWYSDQELLKANKKAAKRQFVVFGEIIDNPKKQPNLFIASTPNDVIKKYEKKKTITWDENTIKYINPDFLDYEREIFKIVGVEELTKCRQEKKSQNNQTQQSRPKTKKRQQTKSNNVQNKIKMTSQQKALKKK